MKTFIIIYSIQWVYCRALPHNTTQHYRSFTIGSKW